MRPGLAGGQEMKDRPVMPDLVLPLRTPGQHTGPQPLHTRSLRVQAPLGMLHPRRGDIEHGDVRESVAEQGTGHAARAAATVSR
jgi:hypothetical protein